MAAFISGCASTKKSSNFGGSTKTKVSVPRVPKFVLPGGNSGNWRYIGTTEDNQIADEIDDSSIKSSKVQTYQYLDRKTIINPNTFNYSKDQPRYKFSISSWEMDCANQQYLLTKATIYDTYGTLIKGYDYSKDDSVKWLKFGQSSIASIQYNYICLNQNKMLGY
ncbi:MAG: surface-adhesin E family protein [Neisseriaceae bacterium]